MASLRSLASAFPRSLASSSAVRVPVASGVAVRYYAAPPPRGPPGPRRPPPPSAQSRQAPPKPKAPVDPFAARNHEIPFRQVHMVDPETDKLGDLQPLHALLRTVDLEVDEVKLVSLDPPVVRVFNVEEEKRRQRELFAKQKLSRRLAIEDKEIQVGWHAAPSDLEHKAQVARHALERGDRVHIIFATRVGGSQARLTPQKKAEVVASFDEVLSPVGEKWKEDERVKGLWVQYWQALPKVREEAKRKLISKEAEKKRSKDEEKEARRLKAQERAQKAKERLEADRAAGAWD